MAQKDFPSAKAALATAKKRGLVEIMVEVVELPNGRFTYTVKSDLTDGSDENPPVDLAEDVAEDVAEAGPAVIDSTAEEVAEEASSESRELVVQTDTLAAALAAAGAPPADPFHAMVQPEALAEAAECGEAVDDEAEEDNGLTLAERNGVDPAMWDHGTQADLDREADDSDSDDSEAAGDEAEGSDSEADAPPPAAPAGMPAWMVPGRRYIIAVEGEDFPQSSPHAWGQQFARMLKRPVVVRDASTFEALETFQPTSGRSTAPRTPRDPNAPKAERGDSEVMTKTIELARRPQGTTRKELESVVKNEKLAWTTMIKKAADKHGYVYHAVTGADRRTTYWLLDEGSPLPADPTSAWNAAAAEAAAKIAGK